MEIIWHDTTGPHMKVQEKKGVTFLTIQRLMKFQGLSTASALGLAASAREFILL